MSKLTKQEQTTVSYYDQSAAEWSDDNSQVLLWEQEMQSYFGLLPKGKILEIGCGSGRDAKELIAHGYDYVGTDLSDGLLKLARDANPGAVFEKANLYDLDYPEKFDGFWCTAVLLHVPRERIQEALNVIHQNMRNHALGFIAIKEGKDQEIRTKKNKPELGRLFVYWQDDEFKDQLDQTGYSVISNGRKIEADGTKWLTYFIEVNKE